MASKRSASAAFELPVTKLCKLSTTAGTSSSKPFRFMDLAGELRTKIYGLVLEDAPTLALTLFKKTDRIPGGMQADRLYYTRPANYKMLLTSKKFFEEAGAVLARRCTLDLSGSTHDEIIVELSRQPWLEHLKQLFDAVALQITNLTVDRRVFDSEHFRTALLTGDLYKNVTTLTVRHAGACETNGYSADRSANVANVVSLMAFREYATTNMATHWNRFTSPSELKNNILLDGYKNSVFA
ncbi:hypothetical protein LTR66_016079, partial [Elasticomyces elasticus]